MVLNECVRAAILFAGLPTVRTQDSDKQYKIVSICSSLLFMFHDFQGILLCLYLFKIPPRLYGSTVIVDVQLAAGKDSYSD